MAIISPIHSSDFAVLAVFLAAALYSSVGHGGASAYLAILFLLGADQTQSVSTALILNTLVAGVACISYARAGYLNLRLTAAFVITSVPAAFIAGSMQVDTTVYEFLLAFALVVSALRLLMPLPVAGNGQLSAGRPLKHMLTQMYVAGGLIGFLSGLIGIGGGILLSPLILIRRWADAKTASATSAAFIVVNSLAALAGRALHQGVSVGSLEILLVAALSGGILGSQLGANVIPSRHIQFLLALVLLVAAGKLLIAACHL